MITQTIPGYGEARVTMETSLDPSVLDDATRWTGYDPIHHGTCAVEIDMTDESNPSISWMMLDKRRSAAG